MADYGKLIKIISPLVEKPATVKIPGHGIVTPTRLPRVTEAIGDILNSQGRLDAMPPEHMLYPDYNRANAEKIADAYDRMQHAPGDPRVAQAYERLIEETMQQYKALDKAGLKFEFLKPGEDDPYARSPALGYMDLLQNNRLKVFPTDAGHGSDDAASAALKDNPLLRRVGPIGDLPNATANDAFRVVHDVLGHYSDADPFFRAKGEDRAAFRHAHLYSDEAIPAAFSETRGQNSWVNAGPHARENATASGALTHYADQKAGLMEGEEPYQFHSGGPVCYGHGGTVGALGHVHSTRRLHRPRYGLGSLSQNSTAGFASDGADMAGDGG